MNDTRPWVEKYRPTQFDDIVLDPLNKKLLENIIIQNSFPNLLSTCKMSISPWPFKHSDIYIFIGNQYIPFAIELNRL